MLVNSFIGNRKMLAHLIRFVITLELLFICYAVEVLQKKVQYLTPVLVYQLIHNFEKRAMRWNDMK